MFQLDPPSAVAAPQPGSSAWWATDISAGPIPRALRSPDRVETGIGRDDLGTGWSAGSRILHSAHRCPRDSPPGHYCYIARPVRRGNRWSARQLGRKNRERRTAGAGAWESGGVLRRSTYEGSVQHACLDAKVSGGGHRPSRPRAGEHRRWDEVTEVRALLGVPANPRRSSNTGDTRQRALGSPEASGSSRARDYQGVTPRSSQPPSTLRATRWRPWPASGLSCLRSRTQACGRRW